jgi:antitoxin MazE
MKARIIPIGNSQGIRIPKSLLQQTGLSGDVEIRAEADALVIRPARKPREGWAKRFKELAQRGADEPLDPYTPTRFDEEEWEWQ